MSPTKQKSLSDLLADDVRDYFLREGVPDQSQQQTTTFQRNNDGGSPLRPGWSAGSGGATGTPTPSSSSSSSLSLSYSPMKKSDNLMRASASLLDENDNRQVQHSQQNSEQGNLGGDENNENQSQHPQQQPHLLAQHRRHSSGSGGSFNSRGSASTALSSRTSESRVRRSAADAEFLRRYAEEKERTNTRMIAAKPNWGLTHHLTPYGGGQLPRDSIIDEGSGKSASTNPYHSILTSTRPPTVTGSHRPGLPSIDGDDWEEDDRIERRDKRREAKKLKKRLHRQHMHQHRRLNSTPEGSSSSRSGSRREIRCSSEDVVPLNDMERVKSVASINSAPGLYSESMRNSLSCSPELSKFRVDDSLRSRSRGDSIETFLRKPCNSMESASVIEQQQDGHFERRDSGHHVRPLSYLSASSESGGDTQPGDDNGNDGYRSRYRTTINHYISSPSPHSSEFSSGGGTMTFGGGQQQQLPYQNNSNYPYLTRQFTQSSNESTLIGSRLLDASRTNSSSSGAPLVNYRQRLPTRQFEDSSDGRYDDSSSSESRSSYSSDSYDSDSSSTNDSRDSSSERRPLRPWHYHQHNKPRDASNFDRSRDIERGGGSPYNERDRLSSGGRNGRANYSTMETSKQQRKKKNRRYNDKSSSSESHRRKSRLGGPECSVPLRLDDAIDVLIDKMNGFLVVFELYISNMPTLVGSLALAWSSMGVDWFKWYEETFDACHPAHYHNKACVFTEFPGCFSCDTSRNGYQFILHFHYLCDTIAFLLASLLLGKIAIAFPVVRDELANPTTAAPLGLLCMAFEKVFAGNFGFVGQSLTLTASAVQMAVAIWFIFISVVYKTLPEPSWFPNTTGLGLAGAKTYLYWTAGGYFLCGLSVLAFVMFWFVALYRIHTNDYISANVCWVQLSGPSVILYGLTIFSQPGSDADDHALLIEENREHFFRIHRMYYMPVLHTVFACCMVSMTSALYLVRTRWKSFREKEFSPAHVIFAAPTVAHTNAMQAYRSSLLKFSSAPPAFRHFLYCYWVTCLVAGTVLVFGLTWKFFTHLPQWCQIDVEDDEMPPAPNETILTQLLQKGLAGDEMKQNYVSAAVLQANESGALVRVLQDGKMKYVRSRRMPSMGFDPIMNMSELMSERERLLQHVTYAAHPSRDRGGILSFDDSNRDSFIAPDPLRASARRRRPNFMSFDASTMMRGEQ